jgi:hypothetical protein
MDTAKEVTGRIGGSQDVLLIEIDEWTPDLEESIEERRVAFDVFDSQTTRVSSSTMSEYPMR